MSRVLLLDLDHTLYPSTSPTLVAVDARITRYIGERLDLDPERADHLRRELCETYGTTLRGLETLHGVDREEYCDFIHAVEEELMPQPDPALRDWLIRTGARTPIYLFTNARRDWADRCLARIGISDLLATEPAILLGILDIGFMNWVGKPEVDAYEKTERHVRRLHGEVHLIFADDRLDNLEQARRRGWETVWVRPHDAVSGSDAWVAPTHRIVDSLLELDPEKL